MADSLNSEADCQTSALAAAETQPNMMLYSSFEIVSFLGIIKGAQGTRLGRDDFKRNGSRRSIEPSSIGSPSESLPTLLSDLIFYFTVRNVRYSQTGINPVKMTCHCADDRQAQLQPNPARVAFFEAFRIRKSEFKRAFSISIQARQLNSAVNRTGVNRSH